ncbi:HoxN/HupN/NixA family nickel/cobalt transporter [Mesorhizobium tamadayense]|uniref:Nickel/cobalt efflux system n=1 Tax=Mesorhizobium tamadayense TaxID=425306 RepID=A0A3P3FT29_9HYPH|nr:HoxN/HupN/NixA family nickel/cobalt transporter [Mesorhizobium tamadayense]RRI01552.1 HoxN/HupN/NixA family nickel/cobalt transporter [Mesorhizobium tamadayense]
MRRGINSLARMVQQVLILASIAIAASATMMQGRLYKLHHIGGVIGASLSAFFLLMIGIANLFILKGIWLAFIRARRGENFVEEDLDGLLAGRGLIARIFRPLFGIVSRSWHMYPIGFLLASASTLPQKLACSAFRNPGNTGCFILLFMIFPALFTAGMSIMDTTDSFLMTGAYRWACVNPVRKLWYNLAITVASVVIAIFIGSIEALAVVADKLGLQGRFWGGIGGINDDLATFGYAIVGIFVVSLLVSMIIYRTKATTK